MTVPIDIATRETLAFIGRHVGLRGCRMLEVGCGPGHLAKALGESGAVILGLDRSEEAIAEARSRGAQAVVADFLSYVDSKRLFDAIIFTRSLHHIHPVAQAIKKADSLLKPGALLVLEDFAAEKMDERTLTWLQSQYAGLSDDLKIPDAECHHQLPLESLDVWRSHHFEKHHVTPSGEMLTAIHEKFEDVKLTKAPYLYRYFIDRLQPTDIAAERLRRTCAAEKEAIAAGSITAIGLRVVVRK